MTEEEKKYPKGISTDGEFWYVETKMGKFKLQELEWDKMEKARKRNPDGIDVTLLSDSIIAKDDKDTTFGELEIKKWPGSVVVRLLACLKCIYDADDFL